MGVRWHINNIYACSVHLPHRQRRQVNNNVRENGMYIVPGNVVIGWQFATEIPVNINVGKAYGKHWIQKSICNLNWLWLKIILFQIFIHVSNLFWMCYIKLVWANKIENLCTCSEKRTLMPAQLLFSFPSVCEQISQFGVK